MNWFLQVITICCLFGGIALMYENKDDKENSVYKFGFYSLLVGIILFIYFVYLESK